MEYQRKFRWANYETSKCKEYLRNDFSYECAYCKLQEKEVGVIDSNYFEIDHFRPQSDDDPSFDPHLYSNLFYSCKKCNREKSDTWSEELLNPCKEHVFTGQNPPISGGYGIETQYKYVPQNEKGTNYINTFKLNSRYHIRVRKQRVNHQNNIHIINELVDIILHKFNSKKTLTNLEELIKQLDQLRDIKEMELSGLSKDENFEAVETLLNLLNIKNSIVFEEYNMDVKVKINDISYYCELIIDESKTDNEENIKYLNVEKLTVWYEKLDYKFGILYFYPKLEKIYFYPISDLIEKKDINSDKKKMRIKLTTENLLTSSKEFTIN